MIHVAFIRNVMQGREGLTRARLHEIFEAAGAVDVQTHLSTGNVSFVGDAPLPRLIEAVEDQIADTIGRREPVFARTLQRLVELQQRQPFDQTPWEEVQDRVVVFLPAGVQAPPTGARSSRGDVAVVGSDGAEVFVVNRKVDGRAAGPGGLVARLVDVPTTSRSWGTVTHIVDKRAGGSSPAPLPPGGSPVPPPDLTVFQRDVAEVVRRLGPGDLATYGEVAREAGHPGAAQAVANVLRSVPDLPWWRVVPSDGRLYRTHIPRQRALLERDGIAIDDQGRIQPR